MNYLEPTQFIDYDTEVIQELVKPYKGLPDKSKSIALYERVRDAWRYDPYTIRLDENNFKASVIAQRSAGNCVEKSILLVACYRAVGLPARLHLGKVKNHIAVERLTEKFGSNELTPHGMVNVKLNDKWLKLSPAFNVELCHKFNVDVLDFDGEHDSFLQAFNSDGDQFMEYTEDYGFFDDVPLEFMKQNIREHYPHIFKADESIREFRL
ncbi:transglutaminase family protein [Winogradskyella sp.]|uniref:transglutaminase-like domain-containing protein n=1 Tax=Winogradskyella sp. TaxID=1883156 RepID=UPI003518D0F3